MSKVADNSQKVTKSNLTKKQINALANFVDPSIGTITEVAEKSGVSRKTIYCWLDDDEFTKALDEKINKYTDSEVANIWKALISKAMNGDTQAIKLYFEMKNKYKQQIQLDVKELPDINLVRGGDG